MYFLSQKSLVLRYRRLGSDARDGLYEQLLECTVDIREILATKLSFVLNIGLLELRTTPIDLCTN